MTMLIMIINSRSFSAKLVSKLIYLELAYVSLSFINSRLCLSRYFPFLAFIYSLHYTYITRFMLIFNKKNDYYVKY